MAEADGQPATGEAAQQSGASGGGHGGVDVEKLAQRVYELMREDIRLALARGESRRGRG